MLTRELLADVRRLQFRARRRAEGLITGEFHTAFKGQGVEFADVREYEPGDDVRTIDWNVTARAGRPYIKRFNEERLREVVVCVDASASMAFGSGSKDKRRLSLEVCAVLSMAAALSGDAPGMVLFTNAVERAIAPARGTRQAMRIIRELVAYEPRSRETNLAAAVTHLARTRSRRALVFLVSDFLDTIDERSLRMLARRHETIGVVIEDPRESEAPRLGLARFQDPETGRTGVVDLSGGSRLRTYHAAALEHAAVRDAALARAGVDRVVLRTNEPFIVELERFLRQRETRR
ncbi:MAG: DUF58 domain-containing protein [Phycisphaerales bacterium]|jgi:uncharacterized protein (DUF58 family)|nr:DUF58 domain-containing protein [Phycisphaerales bacterium]